MDKGIRQIIIEQGICQENIYKSVKAIEKTLNGDGASPGMKIDVDRLKQSAKLQKWLFGLLFTTFLGVIITFFKYFWGK